VRFKRLDLKNAVQVVEDAGEQGDGADDDGEPEDVLHDKRGEAEADGEVGQAVGLVFEQADASQGNC